MIPEMEAKSVAETTGEEMTAETPGTIVLMIVAAETREMTVLEREMNVAVLVAIIAMAHVMAVVMLDVTVDASRTEAETQEMTVTAVETLTAEVEGENLFFD